MSVRTTKSQLTVIIATFIIILAIVDTAYAQTNIPITYNQTLEITKNATESTEGNMVNVYVDNVKKDICKTLVNATEYEECLKL